MRPLQSFLVVNHSDEVQALLKRNQRTTTLWRVVAASLTFASTAVAQENRLPAVIDARASGSAPTRGWTIADIVEVRRITSVAMSADGRRAAFILEQPSIAAGAVRYGLYVIDLAARQPARKVAESNYISSVARAAGVGRWTVLADFGQGVQVYNVDDTGRSTPLLVNRELALIGGNDGLIRAADESSRRMGVIHYDWAPNRSAFWYTRLRLTSDSAQRRNESEGVTYDVKSMFAFSFNVDRTRYLGTELRLYEPSLRRDRLIAFAPKHEVNDQSVFTPSSVQWSADSRTIQYTVSTVSPNGQRTFTRWSANATTVAATPLPDGGIAILERLRGVPRPDANGYLTVRGEATEQRLIAIAADGTVMRDHGAVPYSSLVPSMAWWSPDGARAIFGARYRDHVGLVSFAESQPVDASPLSRATEHVSSCAFSDALTTGVCVRESLTLAPELVAVSPHDGTMSVIAHPNGRHDAIIPLTSERREWTNRFGSVSDGYITYPRGFTAGRRYPVIAVTHGSDAQNKFAYNGFQWDHPVQYFAESGYIVLSVNDPRVTPATRAASNAWLTGGNADAAQMQFFKNVDPVAGMEAALQSVIDAGIADPEKAGIAGYSRGCEVVEFALAHSKAFKVGSEGDAGGWNPGTYWATGTVAYHALYDGLYGGSPYDPKNFETYHRYSPVFRAREFAGPLLQQFAAASGVLGLELHTVLNDAAIPSELVYYPNETHLFWHPGRRAAAAWLSQAWFDYWLLGKRDPSPDHAARYARWDAMASRWKR